MQLIKLQIAAWHLTFSYSFPFYWPAAYSLPDMRSVKNWCLMAKYLNVKQEALKTMYQNCNCFCMDKFRNDRNMSMIMAKRKSVSTHLCAYCVALIIFLQSCVRFTSCHDNNKDPDKTPVSASMISMTRTASSKITYTGKLAS
jgi:hypothetical protein